MTDIQKKLMELLIEIDDICKREKIKYYLCDETAHGAVVEQLEYQLILGTHDGVQIAPLIDNAVKAGAGVGRPCDLESASQQGFFIAHNLLDFVLSYTASFF